MKRALAKKWQQLEQEGFTLTAAFLRALLDPAHPEPQVETLVAKAVQKARQGWRLAYAPFSQFPVGAAVIGESGRIWRGCNVESSSYGLTICAERNALTTAVASGERRIVATVVYAEQELTPPCGACRQMLYEFGPDSVVIVTNGQQQQWFLLAKLLPFAFTSTLFRFPPK